MNWKPLAGWVVHTLSKPDNALLLELASGALLLAWLARAVVE